MPGTAPGGVTGLWERQGRTAQHQEVEVPGVQGGAPRAGVQGRGRGRWWGSHSPEWVSPLTQQCPRGLSPGPPPASKQESGWEGGHPGSLFWKGGLQICTVRCPFACDIL